MSHHPIPTASGPSSNFQSIFDAALNNYKRKTKTDLLAHQLTAQFQDCDSPTAILDLLNRQYNIQRFTRSQNDSGSSKQWLNTTVTVLNASSRALGQGIGMVFSPAKVIFAGIAVFLLAAKDVGASQDALVDLFDRIENFLGRLKIYVEVQLTEAMKNLVVKIMAEILGILAIATKQVRQGWGKRYLKKLIGRTDIEDALKRLEKILCDEAPTGTAQVLKATDSMNNKVEHVVSATQQIENDFGNLKLQAWLSPPDPSINYNAARDAYHHGSAAWFTQHHNFQDWKVSGSGPLLWIHGKPGSGKSILSSTIIHHLKDVFPTKPSNSNVTYFFFDFKDASKQDLRALQSSLLVQLSAQSNHRFKALSDLYSSHDDGNRQPSEDALTECLKSILVVLRQAPTYVIIDALDECPNVSKTIGVPRSRHKVLKFVQELVRLRLPNLHICVTSRPEFDIRSSLEQLAHFEVSLHDQDGQREDIAEYVRSVVYSDNELVMKKWRRELKELVIETLSQRADGMFRWVVCQLETLRECLARNVERVLYGLPKSLDDTYERVLEGIAEENRDDVHRLLQCLVVAIRPLRVEELAEVLTINFNGAEEIPKLNPDWRWEDQEEALQAACSSLIAIVDTGDSRVVQFSHFSVKEFLTSPRLADSSSNVSHYYISLEPAHTILAHSCLGVLLRLPVDDQLDKNGTEGKGDRYNTRDSFPLAVYAARHWVNHAQFGNVSSHIWKGMELLFNPNKPHFSTWLKLYSVDPLPDYDFEFADDDLEARPLANGTPLYYAALWGLHDLTEHLIVNHLQDVNVHGGRNVTPLGAAIAGKYLHLAELLFRHGAALDVQTSGQRTLLQAASIQEDFEIMRWLLSHGVDPSFDGGRGMTELHWAAMYGNLETPLHFASRFGYPDVAQLLLAHGADVNARDFHGSTPLHGCHHNPEPEGRFAVVRLLLEHGADISAVDNKGRTAF
ncbi:hypothetical protein BGW80DRAFT_1560757 [Lactifluus volemus]|nr:hypothetical protein BGW80DRAFT_1560757 [Lactifluus volemus]